MAMGYALASIGLGNWHSHGHSYHGSHACHHAGHAPHGHDEHIGSSPEHLAIEMQGEHRPGSTSEDDCAVCRFLAQSALPVVAALSPTLDQVVAESRVVTPTAPAVWLALGGPARAPPSVV